MGTGQGRTPLAGQRSSSQCAAASVKTFSLACTRPPAPCASRVPEPFEPGTCWVSARPRAPTPTFPLTNPPVCPCPRAQQPAYEGMRGTAEGASSSLKYNSGAWAHVQGLSRAWVPPSHQQSCLSRGFFIQGYAFGGSWLVPHPAEIWLNSIRYAMIDQLRRPRPGFEAATRVHFRLLRWRIMKQCGIWLEQARALDPLFQVRGPARRGLINGWELSRELHRRWPRTYALWSGRAWLSPNAPHPWLMCAPAEAPARRGGGAARPAGRAVTATQHEDMKKACRAGALRLHLPYRAPGPAAFKSAFRCYTARMQRR